MSIYAIADLHLSLKRNKTMDIFGDEWINHTHKIKLNWQSIVGEADTVLVAGDISWAINLEEAEKDLEFINGLNGTKILIRGNHDYWWPTKAKFERFLIEKDLKSIRFIQNDFIELDEYIICGTRGWDFPSEEYKVNDMKIYNRELLRLENSIKEARKTNSNKEIIVMMHFPPYDLLNKNNKFLDIFRKYGIKNVIFGHIHGDNIKEMLEIKFNEFKFKLVSVDAINFKPIIILTDGG